MDEDGPGNILTMNLNQICMMVELNIDFRHYTSANDAAARDYTNAITQIHSIVISRSGLVPLMCG